MREPQKTILEKTKPIFPAVTQPIISAAAFDLTAQDCIRGLINGKLFIDNDGLAAMLQCMHARR